MSNLLEMPTIDRNVETVGISGLRKLDRKRLKSFDSNKMLVIQDHNTPLAVVLGYEKYLILQDQLKAMMETFEIFSDPDEFKQLIEGYAQALGGRSRGIAKIRKDLAK